jgi:hypothetical protein
MREIIRHYLLDDRHYRRAMLVLIGVFSAFAGVMVTLTFTHELPLWYPLLFSAVASLGAGFIAPVAMAVVIQREKAEGSFQLLCALPISKERLFFGTVLAAVVGSLVLWLPGYAVAVLASIPQGVGGIPLLITLGVIRLIALLRVGLVCGDDCAKHEFTDSTCLCDRPFLRSAAAPCDAPSLGTHRGEAACAFRASSVDDHEPCAFHQGTVACGGRSFVVFSSHFVCRSSAFLEQKILCLRLRRLRSSRWRSAMGDFR